MLNFFSFILNQLAAANKKFNNFLNLNSHSINSWKSQTQPVNGMLRSGNRAADYGVDRRQQVSVKKYTAEEVKHCLRGLGEPDRTGAVMGEAGRFSDLVNDGMRRHFRGRERIFERLPFVLYQYTQGKPCLDIARSVSFFSDAQDVEDAMSFAAHLISVKINRGL